MAGLYLNHVKVAEESGGEITVPGTVNHESLKVGGVEVLSSSGNLNLNGNAVINYNGKSLPSTLVPLTIPGCANYIDFDYGWRYINSSSETSRYQIADLGNWGLTWHLRGPSNASWTSNIINNAPGTNKYVMRTSNNSDGTILATIQDRQHMLYYSMGNTWIFIVQRNSGTGYNNAESLITQISTVTGSYQIIREYPTFTDIYNNAVSNLTITRPAGVDAAAASKKWYMLAYTFCVDNKNIVTMFNNAYPNGSETTKINAYDWRWWGTGGSRALLIGDSEWDSESWGVGAGGTNDVGHIGMVAHYNVPLDSTDLKKIFDFYQNQFDFG